MADTISASEAAGVLLISATENPVVINPGVVIQDTAGLGYGIASGLVYNWTITNYGTIIGQAGTSNLSDGILLGNASSGSGGVISNKAGGYIYGDRAGIYVTAPSTVTNAGGIVGQSEGVVIIGSGGAIINQTGGNIHGGIFGAYLSGAASVDNSGTIASAGTAGSVGVLLPDGGYAINRTHAVIHSQYIGVDIATSTSASPGTIVNQGSIYGRIIGVQAVSAPATVTNAGSIGSGDIGTTIASIGVLLAAGGSVNSTGVINGNYFGIDINYGIGAVYNNGAVSSAFFMYGAGVALQDGGSVTNASGGDITSTWKGVQIGGVTPSTTAGTVINQGVILADDTLGDGAGVWINAPGEIVNGPGALISGGAFGIVAYYNVTVINRGSVFATQDAFENAHPNNVNRIVLYPGASFTGVVDANDTIGVAASTLELGSGSSTGTVTGFGNQYQNFTDVQVDSGAAWNFGGTVASNQTIVLAGTQDSLTLENPEAMNGTLSGFTTGDLVVLAGVTDATGLSLSGSDVLTVSRAGNPDLTIQLSGVVPAVSFTSVAGATDLTVPCFAAGTMIRTPAGDVPVETIRAGAHVVSGFGGHRQVIWVGQRDIDCRRHPKPTLVWPIQIDAHAFGPGLPETDLRVSPDHAIYLNTVLIPARHLVNGDTVRQVPVDTIKYFHIELKTHDILLANSLPAESYLDVGDRSNFSDSAVMRLFPDFAPPADGIAALWEAKGCAPLVIHGPTLDAIKAMLAARGRDRQAVASHAA